MKDPRGSDGTAVVISPRRVVVIGLHPTFLYFIRPSRYTQTQHIMQGQITCIQVWTELPIITRIVGNTILYYTWAEVCTSPENV